MTTVGEVVDKVYAPFLQASYDRQMPNARNRDVKNSLAKYGIKENDEIVNCFSKVTYGQLRKMNVSVQQHKLNSQQVLFVDVNNKWTTKPEKLIWPF
jgi:hypothetical protein